MLKKANWLNEYRFLQVKEKWGELRIYDTSVPSVILDEYHAILDKYVEKSRHTCAHCGSEDAKMTDAGYMIPYCKDCWENTFVWTHDKKYEDYVVD